MNGTGTEPKKAYTVLSLDVREELTDHVTDLFQELMDPAPLSVSALRMGAGEPWRLEAIFDAEPAPAAVDALVERAGAAGPPRQETLADEDWVARANAAMPALRTNRLFIRGPHIPVPDDLGSRRLLTIEAGLAFGTGHHATTLGCLKELERLAKARRPARVLDLGTGTGLLALAAGHLWPDARLLATDIDPVAVTVARENARLNDCPPLRAVPCAGFASPAVRAEGPFDLIIANILAAPLIGIAGDLAAHLAPGGQAVLAGLLGTQANAVLAAYRARGLRLASRHDEGDWAILVLQRPDLDLSHLKPIQGNT